MRTELHSERERLLEEIATTEEGLADTDPRFRRRSG